MANQVYLETDEDMDWLRDVHGIDTTDVVGAYLYGNEDAPERIEAYYENDYRATPMVYLPNEQGIMIPQVP